MTRRGQDWSFKDETGHVHGSWRALERVTGGNGARWKCRCEICGAVRFFYGYTLRAGLASRCMHTAQPQP
jgi:hypothetical protein